jgi:membrane protease YdiL (CAAX protease family)
MHAKEEAVMEGGRDEVVSIMPRRFFYIALGYLAVLLGVFVLWETWSGFRDWLPDELGPLPFEVPWFGALGGSLISLAGIFDHNRGWDPKFNYWHYARPVVGAVIGSVGALLFYVIGDLANSNPIRVNATVFDVVAFLVGYREASFRELIQRATDLLIRPGAAAKE